MDVITCHLNADFDALASMMAAKKLYPDAHVVFPGSQERSLRDFFLQSAFYTLHVERVRDLDMDEVTRLIVVDAKRPSRIGPFAELLERPGVEVHVYDHHPHKEGDIKADFEHVEPIGACTTLFVEILKAREIDISPVEATVLALGIYEETGSLSFTSTTPRDVMAAAWLLEKGANLNIVSDFIIRELDADQVSILNDLLKSMKVYNFEGVKVVVASATSRRYVQDVAMVVHKLRDMENMDALFCVVGMEDRVHMVARSRVDEVDAGAVAYKLGGGGHPTAASATLRNMNVDTAVEKVVKTLKELVRPSLTAHDMMTTPVMTVGADEPISDAGERLTRYGVNVMPVVDEGGAVKGLISRETIQKSLHHGLGGFPVKDYMTTDFKEVSPKTPFKNVEEIMIRRIQRFVPVVENGVAVGAITRTDLLRALDESLARRARFEVEIDKTIQEAFSKNLAGMVKERMPAETLELVRELGAFADERGVSAFVVGGFVRDLIMGDRNLDLDIVVEAPGIEFAKEFAEPRGGRVRPHHRFGTAVVVMPDGFKFDVATARTEYYEYPAALPTVEVGSIKKDLYRRDFTINALAIRINERGFGDLIDFFGGQRDLKEKTIRVLHNLSLIEDPTRAFRAIRFSVRMDFSISRHTQNLIKKAAEMGLFSRLSGKRLYTELKLIFKEAHPLEAVEGMDDYGLLGFVHPDLKLDKELARLMDSIAETLGWFRLLYTGIRVEEWLVCIMGLFDSLPPEELEKLQRPFGILDKRMKKLRLAKTDGLSAIHELGRRPKMTPYEVYTLLGHLPPETLLYMMAKAKQEKVKKKISQYLTHHRTASTMLDGNDLLEMGIPPGPAFKAILDKLLEARLNGKLETKDDERGFVRELVEKHPGALEPAARSKKGNG